MKNNSFITYRGANLSEDEFKAQRQDQLQQQQGEQLIQYRGHSEKVDVTTLHPHSVDHVKYRGAEADMDVEH